MTDSQCRCVRRTLGASSVVPYRTRHMGSPTRPGSLHGFAAMGTGVFNVVKKQKAPLICPAVQIAVQTPTATVLELQSALMSGPSRAKNATRAAYYHIKWKLF